MSLSVYRSGLQYELSHSDTDMRVCLIIILQTLRSRFLLNFVETE